MARTILYPTFAPRGIDASEVAPPPYDPGVNGFPFPPQQDPVSHCKFAAAATGRATGFGVETVITAIGQVAPQIPTPHRRCKGFTPDISQPLEPSLFQVAAEDVTLDKWFRPQQEPLRHGHFQSPSSVVMMLDTSELEGFTQNLAWAQPQSLAQPIHKRKPWSDQYTRGYDDAEFVPPGVFNPATGFAWPTQQGPVKHRRYNSPSEVVGGIQPTLLEAFSQNLAWAQPQADPHPLKTRQVWLDQLTRGYDAVEFVPPGTFDPGTGFAWPTQQAPIKHRRYAADSTSVSGQVPSLLDAFSQNLAWAQPQALPQPIKKRKPWLDQYVKGVTDAEIAPPFDVATYAFPPQELPGRHRHYQGWQEAISGTQTTLLEPQTQNVSWIQPQQRPLRHRWYQAASTLTSGIETGLLEPLTSNLAWVQPQQEPLPIAKRNVYLDQFAFAANPQDFIITVEHIGLEFTALENLMHYSAAQHYQHFTAKPNAQQFTAEENDS